MNYVSLRNEIESKGYFTIIEDDPELGHRLVCASKRRPEGGYMGNSFWIAFRSSRWYLGTWGSRVYEFLDNQQIVELCIHLLKDENSGPLSEITSEVMNDYCLKRISERSYRKLGG